MIKVLSVVRAWAAGAARRRFRRGATAAGLLAVLGQPAHVLHRASGPLDAGRRRWAGPADRAGDEAISGAAAGGRIPWSTGRGGGGNRCWPISRRWGCCRPVGRFGSSRWRSCWAVDDPQPHRLPRAMSVVSAGSTAPGARSVAPRPGPGVAIVASGGSGRRATRSRECSFGSAARRRRPKVSTPGAGLADEPGPDPRRVGPASLRSDAGRRSHPARRSRNPRRPRPRRAEAMPRP